MQKILFAATRLPGLYWWVGLSWRSASMKRAWRSLKRRCQPFARINETAHEILLPNGSQIWLRTAEAPESLAGEGVRGAVVDEFTMMQEVVWTEQLRATLSDFQGWALFIGVPKGLNWGAVLFERGQDPHEPNWKSWQMPTVSNPFIDPAEVEEAKRDLPQAMFEQEYLAQILQSAGAVFRRIPDNLNALITTPAAHQGHFIVGGIDWAQRQDYTCCSVFCVTCKCELELDRYNKIDWQLQRGRVRNYTDKWGVRYWLAETNSIGSPNLEALVSEGIPAYGFETTQNSKHEMIQSLALAFERVEAQWLPDPVAKAELQAYEVTISKNGRPSYSAPDGLHDDTVIARGLAWRAATTYGVGVQYGDSLW